MNIGQCYNSPKVYNINYKQVKTISGTGIKKPCKCRAIKEYGKRNWGYMQGTAIPLI